MPKLPARRIPVMVALAVLIGFGFASIPEQARAADGPVAVPVSPVDRGVFTDGELAFEWTTPHGAADYELRSGLDGRIDAEGELVEAPSTSTLRTSASTLTVSGLPEATYYWQVRARDASGEPGPWSAVRTVTIDLPGDGGGLQLETLPLGDYIVEQAPVAPAVTGSGPGVVGMLSIAIASAFSVLLLGVVLRRAAAVRVRT